MKVFWSWQSDTPGNIGRFFVRDVLTEAITELKETPEIEEREERELLSEIHLDQDRQDVPGSPDLANLILEKIRNSKVIVADVTLGGIVASPPNGKIKKLISSNVAIELGYSLGVLTDRALLMVINEHYGARAELPFDLQTKAGHLIFNLPPGADKTAIASAARKLKSQFKIALKFFLGEHAEAIRQQRPFPAAEPQNSPNFRLPGNPLGMRINPFPIGPANEQAVFLTAGPAIWLRLTPTSDPGKTWPPYELKKAAFVDNQILLEPLCQRGLYGLRAEDGFGHCALNSDDAPETSAIAFAFVTGEVWSVDTLLLSVSGNIIPFLEDYFAKGLHRYGCFLAGLGIKPLYHWKAGVTDVKGRHLSIPPPPGRSNFPGMVGPECMSAAIIEKGLYDGVQTPTNALLPFFKKIFDKCDTPRPNHLSN